VDSLQQEKKDTCEIERESANCIKEERELCLD